MESTLKKDILRWQKSQADVWLQKYPGSSFGLKGHPDIYGHVKSKAVYFELKQPGEKLEKIQAAIGRKIKSTGAFFCKIDTFQEFLDAVEEIRNPRA